MSYQKIVVDTISKGKYVVGSIGNKMLGMRDGEVSISKSPHQHDTLVLAKKEAERLASLQTDVEFVVFEVKGIVKASNTVWR